MTDMASPGSSRRDASPFGESERDVSVDSTESQTSPPLVSLTSLLGGDVEGGASCAPDGTCD